MRARTQHQGDTHLHHLLTRMGPNKRPTWDTVAKGHAMLVLRVWVHWDDARQEFELISDDGLKSITQIDVEVAIVIALDLLSRCAIGVAQRRLRRCNRIVVADAKQDRRLNVGRLPPGVVADDVERETRAAVVVHRRPSGHEVEVTVIRIRCRHERGLAWPPRHRYDQWFFAEQGSDAVVQRDHGELCDDKRAHR